MRRLDITYLVFFLAVLLASCRVPVDRPVMPGPKVSITVSGQAVIKVLPCSGGWISLQETLQPEYLIEQPKRAISWRDEKFSGISSYEPPPGWSLIDAVTHPSGEVSAVNIKVDPQRGDSMEIKVLRFSAGNLVAELEVYPIPLPDPQTFYFPVSIDRIQLVPYGEDVYLI